MQTLDGQTAHVAEGVVTGGPGKWPDRSRPAMCADYALLDLNLSDAGVAQR